MLARLLVALMSFVGSAWSLVAAAEIDITIGYLERVIPPPPVLSNLEEVPEDRGLAGAGLGIDDGNTTGRFLKHTYTLDTVLVGESEDFLAAAKNLLSRVEFLIVNAPTPDLTALADLSEAEDVIFFNVSSRDRALRSKDCRANLFHTIPSRAMLADALAQFALKKRWTNWVLIEGVHDRDKAFAAALEKSAVKFQLNLLGKKQWAFDADMRRNAAQEVPFFTQDFPDHDLLVIADEINDFGRYVMYNTWLARPIAGSEGIVPSAWSRSVEQHGAAQLQSRFRKKAGRDMQSIDYAAWAAVRSISEGVTRTQSGEVKKIRNYLLSDKFELAGFKGRKLTYRGWNGQLRQPIPLTHPRAVVALAPLEGFLHQRNELDTLGLDQPESECSVFGGQ